MVTTVRLPEEIERRLDRLAATTGRSKSYYLRELIESGLDRIEWEYTISQRAADVRRTTRNCSRRGRQA